MRLDQYCRDNSAGLPTSADQLPLLPERDCGTTDGWGRELIWKHGERSLQVISYGRDGKPGGSGEDADHAFSYSREEAAKQLGESR